MRRLGVRRRRRFPAVLRADTRGAVIVEFVVAVVPLLFAFFSLAQIAMVYTAKIMLRHAAIDAVRAYAVINPPNPGQNGTPTTDPTNAGIYALGPWYSGGGTAIQSATFSFSSQANTNQPYGYYELDTVTAQGTYVCSVPLGQWLACGMGKTTNIGPYTATYPHQGARYQCNNNNCVGSN